MSEIKKMQIDGVSYDIKDATARQGVQAILNSVASAETKGLVKVDNETIEADENGVISVKAGTPIPAAGVNAFRWSFLFIENKDFNSEENGYLLYLPFIEQDADQNVTIDWGDTTTTTITAGSHIDGYIKHVYNTHGLKTVTITCDNMVAGAENTMPKMATMLETGNYEGLPYRESVMEDSNLPINNGLSYKMWNVSFQNTITDEGSLGGMTFSLGSQALSIGNSSGSSTSRDVLIIDRSDLEYNGKYYGLLSLSFGSTSVSWYAYKVTYDDNSGYYTVGNTYIDNGYASMGSGGGDAKAAINLLSAEAGDKLMIVVNAYYSGVTPSFMYAMSSDNYVGQFGFNKRRVDSYSGYNGGSVTVSSSNMMTIGAFGSAETQLLIDTTTAMGYGFTYLNIDMGSINSGTVEAYGVSYSYNGGSPTYTIIDNGTQYDLSAQNILNIYMSYDYILLVYSGDGEGDAEMLYSSKPLSNLHRGIKGCWRDTLVSVDCAFLRMKGDNSYQTSLSGMFYDCKKLSSFPEDLLRKIGKDLVDTESVAALEQLFRQSGLQEYPSNFLKASYFTNNVKSLADMFSYSKLVKVNKLGDAIGKIFTDFSNMFSYTPLPELREDLFDGILDDENNANKTYIFDNVFSHTSIYTTNRVFTKLFLLNYWVDDNGTPTNRYNFKNAFAQCNNLEIKASDFVTDLDGEIASQYYDSSSSTLVNPSGNDGLYAANISTMFMHTYERDSYNEGATRSTQANEYEDPANVPAIRVPNLWDIEDGSNTSSNIGTYCGNGNNSSTIYGYSSLDADHHIYAVANLMGLLG